MSFQKAIDFVLPWECVYDANGNVTWEDVPGDLGGPTRYGIDQASHPNVDIKRLTREQALEIYRHDYWSKIKGDDIAEPLDMVVMDIAVNNGVGRASKWLQEAVGAIPDGIIGPKTLRAVAGRNPVKIGMFLLGKRDQFYREIASGAKSKFLTGWLNRNNSLKEIVEGF